MEITTKAINNMTNIPLRESDKDGAPENLTLWAWSLQKKETNNNS
jgi:hypothetical protein